MLLFLPIAVLVCTCASVEAKEAVNEVGEVYQEGSSGTPGYLRREIEIAPPPPFTHYTEGMEHELKVYIHEPEFLVRAWKEGLAAYPAKRPVWSAEYRVECQHLLDYWLYEHLKVYRNRVHSPEEADVYFVPTAFVLMHGVYHRGRLWAQHGSDVWEWLSSNEWYRRYPHRHVVPLPSYHALKVPAVQQWLPRFLSDGGIPIMVEYRRRIPAGRPFITVPYVAHTQLPRSNASGRIPGIDSPQRRMTFYGRWTNRWGSPRTRLAQVPWSSVGGAVHSGTYEMEHSTKFNAHTRTYAEEILSAKFCLIPRGDTPSSRRLYDAVHAGCLPVLLSDAWDHTLPFRHSIAWDDFIFRVGERENYTLSEFQFIVDTPAAVLREMQRRLLDALPYLTYGDPVSGSLSVSKVLPALLRELAQYIDVKGSGSE